MSQVDSISQQPPCITSQDDCTSQQPPYKLLYYCYLPLGPEGRARLVSLLSRPISASLSGQLRIGLDGLNVSLGGPRAALQAHCALVSSLPEVLASGSAIDFKFAPHLASRSGLPSAAFAAYTVLSVAEIVTLGDAASQVSAASAARHAAPAEFHALLTGAEASPPHSLLIDVRNAFESAIGTLEPCGGSNLQLLRPQVRRFEDMVAWTEAHAQELAQAPRIAMFCTGGVRCERFSALLRSRFSGADVVQLQGGVQRYMEAAEAGALGQGGAAQPEQQQQQHASRWRGKLYVFDERPAVAVAGEPLAAAAASPHLPGMLGACVRCRAPHDQYDTGARCSSCRVLVLVCPPCQALAEGPAAADDADADSVVCDMCSQGVAWERARTRVRGRKPREARLDLVQAAAARRAAREAEGGGQQPAGSEAPPLEALFEEQ